MKKRFEMSSLLTTTILKGSNDGTLTNQDRGNQVLIGRFSTAARTALKIDDLNVVTSISILEKVMTKHGLSPEMAANLKELILDPIEVYKSDTKGNSIVLVSATLVDNDPLVAAIIVNAPDAAGKPNMHWMSSAYPKENPDIFAIWEAKGLLLWRP